MSLTKYWRMRSHLLFVPLSASQDTSRPSYATNSTLIFPIRPCQAGNRVEYVGYLPVQQTLCHLRMMTKNMWEEYLWVKFQRHLESPPIQQLPHSIANLCRIFLAESLPMIWNRCSCDNSFLAFDRYFHVSPVQAFRRQQILFWMNIYGHLWDANQLLTTNFYFWNQ